MPPRVTCYEKALLTFKFYVARMTWRLQIFVLAHSWNIRRTQSALVHHKIARLFLSRRELGRKFTIGLSRIYWCLCVYFSRFLRTILFSPIFFLRRGFITGHLSVSSLEDYLVQCATIGRKYAKTSPDRTCCASKRCELDVRFYKKRINYIVVSVCISFVPYFIPFVP